MASEHHRSFLLALSYQGRKSQKSPAQAIVEGGRLIKGEQEISAITTWRKNIHKMSFKMPCHRYYRLPQTGVWRSRREVLAVGSGQRPSNSSIMDQSRHLTRSPQCSASNPLPLKRGKIGQKDLPELLCLFLYKFFCGVHYRGLVPSGAPANILLMKVFCCWGRV